MGWPVFAKNRPRSRLIGAGRLPHSEESRPPERLWRSAKEVVMGARSITPTQREQYMRLMREASERGLVESQLDEQGFERLTRNHEELVMQMIGVIQELSLCNRFTDEEIVSNIVYPPTYRIRNIADQIDTLRRFFPTLGSANMDIGWRPVPFGAEGWFAIPRWEKIATSYCEAFNTVVEKLESTRRVSNRVRGYVNPFNLRQNRRTASMFQKLCQQQEEHDILIVPAQFGQRHAGRSPRRAHELFTFEEFALGLVAAGCMLLAHPDRLAEGEHLQIDCPGDEWSAEKYGTFTSVTVLDFGERDVEIRTRSRIDHNVHYGSATGFISL